VDAPALSVIVALRRHGLADLKVLIRFVVGRA
jgi:hypothetical protein